MYTGFGESQKEALDNTEKVEFMEQLMIHAHLKRPVIVSPSMSGSFSIPYIMSDQPSTCTERIAGFIPVAPVGTEKYSHAHYHRCEVNG
jgi:abhydrolase domain-containing protein 14